MPQYPAATIVGFLYEARNVCRLGHSSFHTEETYLLFHDNKHPAKRGADAIRQYFIHLAAEQNVASTQNAVMNALVFLYRDVLGTELAETRDVSG